MISKETVQIIGIVSPLVFGAILAWFAYRYAIRQKKFDSNQEYYKKVRRATSNLLVLWKDINRIILLLKDESRENQVLVESNLAPTYLKLDEEKITFLEDRFDEAVDVIQELDAVLYSKMEGAFDRFYEALEDVFQPLVYDPQVKYSDKIAPAVALLERINSDLKEDIKELTERLPQKEGKQVTKYMTDHEEHEEDESLEIPVFLVRLINSTFKLREEISSDEIILFYSNPTVKWAFAKIYQTGFYNQVFGTEFYDFFRFFLVADKQKEEMFSQLTNQEQILTFLSKLKISEEEELNHLMDNKTFYLMLLGLIKKIDGKLTFESKRDIAKLNLGVTSIRNEIEKLITSQ